MEVEDECMKHCIKVWPTAIVQRQSSEDMEAHNGEDKPEQEHQSHNGQERTHTADQHLHGMWDTAVMSQHLKPAYRQQGNKHACVLVQDSRY